MDRNLFRLISLGIWVIIISGIVSGWAEMVKIADSLVPQSGVFLAGIVVAVGLFLLVVLQSLLTDRIKFDTGEAKRPPREVIERQIDQVLAKGNKREALRLCEANALLQRAADIARELNDRHALVRLFSKMGHHDRARRLYLEMKDFEAAAQASILMNEISTARDLYKEAAQAREEAGAKPEVLGGLWDRAGDWITAARLYEEGGALERAAECFSLLDDPLNARRCEESAKLLEAYERRRDGDVTRSEQQEAEYRTDLTNAARILEQVGDLLGAGFTFRKAGQMIEAAVAFERFEEWERAARIYDEISLPDRASIARSHLPEKPVRKESEAQNEEFQPGGPLPIDAPPPGMMAVRTFVPAAEQTLYVPINIGQSFALQAPQPELLLKIAQRIRRGNFEEAAEFSKEANDWLMAAALYERAGNLVQAADTYRSIGKLRDAQFCLERAERPREAAMLSLALGDEEHSMIMLRKAVDEGDRAEAGMMLLRLMVRRGEAAEALKTLKETIAPPPITPETAATYYRFARLVEGAGATQEAYEAYSEMISAGAESPDITRRVAYLSDALSSGAEQKITASGRVTGGSATMVFTAPSESKRFVFEVPPDLDSMAGPGTDITISMARGVSLFGAPAAQDSVFVADPSADMDLPAASGSKIPLTPDPKSKAPSADPFQPQERYRIKREIARGGMGVVFEAEDTALGRQVALKLIQTVGAPAEATQAFLLEARAIARLSHPNVVMIYDIGVMDLQHYITMELVTGNSLHEHVEAKDGLGLGESLRIFVEIARGLQVAHDAGIVHRDVKPGNILLTDKGAVKIVDFGLAKLAAGGEDGESGKTIFRMSGTPGFMAPEQIDGEESLPRVDIYALGVTLFTMIAGKPPHSFANMTKPRQIISYQLAGKLPSLRDAARDVPHAIAEVFEFCTMLDPAKRYQRVDDFLPVAEQWASALRA